MLANFCCIFFFIYKYAILLENLFVLKGLVFRIAESKKIT